MLNFKTVLWHNVNSSPDNSFPIYKFRPLIPTYMQPSQRIWSNVLYALTWGKDPTPPFRMSPWLCFWRALVVRGRVVFYSNRVQFVRDEMLGYELSGDKVTLCHFLVTGQVHLLVPWDLPGSLIA